MALTIIEKTPDGEIYYLNRSCLRSLGFGDEDMAWSTDNRMEADLMLERVRRAHSGTESIYQITEHQ